MKRGLFILLLIQFFLPGHASSKSLDSTSIFDKETKQLLIDIKNNYLKKNSIILSTETKDPITIEFLKIEAKKDPTLFKEIDFDFINKQISSSKNFSWENLTLDSIQLINNSEIKLILKPYSDSSCNVFRKKNGSNFYKISYPNFSKDMHTCVIKIDHYCGPLCGNGGILIFKKLNNKWTFYKSLSEWIS